MDIRDTVGLNVQRLRRDKDWSQEDLAFESGLHRTYVSGVERGVRNPTVLVLEAIARGLELAAAGADLLDIGGESTRPYSQEVQIEEELRRVAPVIAGLAEQTDVPLSIDTSKPEVAKECLAAGAEVINDVTALADSRMVQLAVESAAGVCIMHMQGTPQTHFTECRSHDGPLTETVPRGEAAAFRKMRLQAQECQWKGKEE